MNEPINIEEDIEILTEITETIEITEIEETITITEEDVEITQMMIMMKSLIDTEKGIEEIISKILI